LFTHAHIEDCHIECDGFINQLSLLDGSLHDNAGISGLNTRAIYSAKFICFSPALYAARSLSLHLLHYRTLPPHFHFCFIAFILVMDDAA
jgi:hypothetical protein